MGRYYSLPIAEYKAGGNGEIMTRAVPARGHVAPLRPCVLRTVAGLGVQFGVGGTCSLADGAPPAVAGRLRPPDMALRP